MSLKVMRVKPHNWDKNVVLKASKTGKVQLLPERVLEACYPHSGIVFQGQDTPPKNLECCFTCLFLGNVWDTK